MANNIVLYNAALLGFSSGILSGRATRKTNPNDYGWVLDNAIVFATEMDSLIPNDNTISQPNGEALPSTPLQSAKSDLLFGLCKSYLTTRFASKNTYLSICQVIKAEYDKLVPSILTNVIFPDTAGGSCVLEWGNLDIATSATVRYLSPGYDSVTAPTLMLQYRIPMSGTLDQARVRCRTPGTPLGGPPGNINYRVRIENGLSPLVVTMHVTALDGQNLLDSAIVNAGDRIHIEVTKPGGIMTSPSSPIFSMRFRPD